MRMGHIGCLFKWAKSPLQVYICLHGVCRNGKLLQPSERKLKGEKYVELVHLVLELTLQIISIIHS